VTGAAILHQPLLVNGCAGEKGCAVRDGQVVDEGQSMRAGFGAWE
jgi:hypothetical protein